MNFFFYGTSINRSGLQCQLNSNLATKLYVNRFCRNFCSSVIFNSPILVFIKNFTHKSQHFKTFTFEYLIIEQHWFQTFFSPQPTRNCLCYNQKFHAARLFRPVHFLDTCDQYVLKSLSFIVQSLLLILKSFLIPIAQYSNYQTHYLTLE